MIPVRVVLLPALLRPDDLMDRSVVVFDVLRATTTIAAALSCGAREVRVYDSLEAVRSAAGACAGPKVLAGEHRCLPPQGFDLGNSPADFDASRCDGRIVFLSTTNGTRALHAARSAAVLMTGAVVNATATARALQATGRPITLLAAGTNAQFAMEDVLGCGAVIAALGDVLLENDAARAARSLWQFHASDLPRTLEQTTGGRNVIDAGLRPDIAFAASLDRIDAAVRVTETAGVLAARAWRDYDRIV